MIKDEAYEQLLWKRIEEHIPNISKREARFRQVDKLPVLGAFMKAFEQNCPDSMLYRKEIEKVIANLPDVLRYKATELEKEIDSWTTHLRVHHGVYPSYYFNYRYSAYGLFSGILLGAGFSYLFNGILLLQWVGLVASFALIIGVLYGSRLDARIKSEGRNY